MAHHRAARRAFGFVLIVLGGILMWAAASPIAGSVLFALAIALEAAGIALERRDNGGKAGG